MKLNEMRRLEEEGMLEPALAQEVQDLQEYLLRLHPFGNDNKEKEVKVDPKVVLHLLRYFPCD